MTKTLDQRRDARIAARDTDRREDAELDQPLLIAALEAVTGDLASAREKVATALQKLIVTHPLLAGQVQTLGTLENNLVNIVSALLKDVEAVLAPPAEAETPTN
ncbi:MAG: hypothetical protein JWR59_622 [Brevundimonas sp.]|nr:hypothetical protein [Brevundimonas sp.]